MARDQSWTTPWGWDDSEGDDAPMTAAKHRPIDHTHVCPQCKRVSQCYAPGCGMPRAFVCGSCVRELCMRWRRFVDRDGQPITFEQWIALLAADHSGAYRVLARTDVGDAGVSTVWLGINHGWDLDGLYFETKIFGGPHDGFTQRYRTRAEADAAHARLVARLEAGMQPDDDVAEE